MPHSPRLYDGRLWVLNSGEGEFGTVDPATGAFTAVCFCPGYARGLAFVGRHAVIGLSRPRHNQTFSGLKLEERLAAEGRGPALRAAGRRHRHRQHRRMAPLRAHHRRALRRGGAPRRASGRGDRVRRRRHPARAELRVSQRPRSHVSPPVARPRGDRAGGREERDQAGLERVIEVGLAGEERRDLAGRVDRLGPPAAMLAIDQLVGDEVPDAAVPLLVFRRAVDLR